MFKFLKAVIPWDNGEQRFSILFSEAVSQERSVQRLFLII